MGHNFDFHKGLLDAWCHKTPTPEGVINTCAQCAVVLWYNKYLLTVCLSDSVLLHDNHTNTSCATCKEIPLHRELNIPFNTGMGYFSYDSGYEWVHFLTKSIWMGAFFVLPWYSYGPYFEPPGGPFLPFSTLRTPTHTRAQYLLQADNHEPFFKESRSAQSILPSAMLNDNITYGVGKVIPTVKMSCDIGWSIYFIFMCTPLCICCGVVKFYV